jgi:hypothetical protein
MVGCIVASSGAGVSVLSRGCGAPLHGSCTRTVRLLLPQARGLIWV